MATPAERPAVILTGDEIAALTDRVQHPAQLRVLRHLGIEHRVRPDGSIIVLRAHLEAVLGGGMTTRAPAAPEPNWSAI